MLIDIESMISHMIQRPRVQRLIQKDHMTQRAAEIIYGRDQKKRMFWKIWTRRVISFLVACCICAGLFLYCAIRKPSTDETLVNNVINRNDEAVNVTFQVIANTQEGIAKEELTLHLKQRLFNKQECEEIEKEADAFIEKALLGNNKSCSCINKKINLIECVPSTGVLIKWRVDDQYFDEKGNIRAIEEGMPIQTTVEADALWNNWEKTYTFRLCIEPSKRSVKEIALSNIRNQIEASVESQSTSKKIHLPDKINGSNISYETKQKPRDFSVAYLSLAVIILLPFAWFRKQKEELRRRDEELMLDYPVLVNKIVLLLSAGLTIRGSVERICGEYKRRLDCGEQKRFAYEELSVCYQEMKNGISETAAIEAFGQRCRQLPYMRFSSIINQNIRKGSDGLTALLEKEVIEAFEQRKEMVKQMGEKAGTKLLLPMILMLGVVMGIIIVPAFMTM